MTIPIVVPPMLEGFNLKGSIQEVQNGGSTVPWLPVKNKRLYTNAFIVQDEKVAWRDQLLLGYKKRGFGVHKYNGFGGKVEEGESVLDAAKRELKEEAGIDAPLKHYGTFVFVTEGGPDWAFQIEIFRAEDYSGTLVETDEMRFQWFSVQDIEPHEMHLQTDRTRATATSEPDMGLGPIPFERMWEADRYWIPLLLAKRHFIGRTDFKKIGEDHFALQRWWFGVDPNENA